jgi:hypothetical protein
MTCGARSLDDQRPVVAGTTPRQRGRDLAGVDADQTARAAVADAGGGSGGSVHALQHTAWATFERSVEPVCATRPGDGF